jgi:hypothetical protein
MFVVVGVWQTEFGALELDAGVGSVVCGWDKNVRFPA